MSEGRDSSPDTQTTIVVSPPPGELVLFLLGTTCAQCGCGHDLSLHQRQALRDFLRFVPRTETMTRLRVVRPDRELVGERSRLELSAALDGLYLRHRHVLRLHVEAGAARSEVTGQLGISMKTLERDEVEALDTLWRFLVGAD